MNDLNILERVSLKKKSSFIVNIIKKQNTSKLQWKCWAIF